MLRDSRPNNALLGYLVALLVVLLAAAFRAGVLGMLESRIPYVTFFPAVMLASFYGGFYVGLLATLVSAFLASYWIGPDGKFLDFRSTADLLGMAVFILSNIATAWIIESWHRSQIKLKQAEMEAVRADE